MRQHPDFDLLAYKVLDAATDDMTKVFFARLLEGDTYIYLDTSGGVSLVTGQELTSKIKQLTDQGVEHGQRVVQMGDGLMGGIGSTD